MTTHENTTTRRRLGRLTREGRVFVLVTVGVGVAAVNTGNNLLYLTLGMLLSLLLVSMVMSEVVLYGLRFSRHVASRGTAGTPLAVELVVTNTKKRIPSYALEIVDHDMPGTGTRFRCLKVEAGGKHRGHYLATFPHRGRFEFRHLHVVSRYPFGLVQKTHVHRVPGNVLVYPRQEQVPYSPSGGSTEGTEAPSQRLGWGSEIAGIRGYRPGDGPRDIHALRSAALGRWVVRERERDAHRNLALALDTRAPTERPSSYLDRFERMIRRAAFIAQDAVLHGASVRIVSASGSSPAVAPGTPVDPLLAFLAELQPSGTDEQISSQGSGASRGIEQRVLLEP